MQSRIFAAGLALLLGIASLAAQEPKPAVRQTRTLKVGDPAPDFSLPDQNGKIVRLSDFRGKQNVVLAFFVLAFTSG